MEDNAANDQLEKEQLQKIQALADKGLLKKLLFIQQEVDHFIFDDKTYAYKYVTGNQVLGKIRPLMNKLGLLLQVEVLKIENSRQDYKTKDGKEKNEILTTVDMRLTWIDTDSKDTQICNWGGNGQNDWDKGFGSAITYGERYFLMKYFHVPTDEDDPDNNQKKKDAAGTGKNTPPPPPPPPTTPQKPKIVKDSKPWKQFVERIESGEMKSLDTLKTVVILSEELEKELNGLLEKYKDVIYKK